MVKILRYLPKIMRRLVSICTGLSFSSRGYCYLLSPGDWSKVKQEFTVTLLASGKIKSVTISIYAASDFFDEANQGNRIAVISRCISLSNRGSGRFEASLRTDLNDGSFVLVISGRIGLVNQPFYIASGIEIHGSPSIKYEPIIVKTMPINMQRGLKRKLNILLPRLAMENATGGPNTVYIFAYQLAKMGVPIRFVSAMFRGESDFKRLHHHVAYLAGSQELLANVEFVDPYADTNLVFGQDDIFLATAWETAVIANDISHLQAGRPFIYFIQDYEPCLYAHSSRFILALNTYSYGFIAVVNHPFLLEYFLQAKIGRFEAAEFRANAISFAPAVDRKRFFPVEKVKNRKKKILFYARPRVGLRNLFEIGVEALRMAVERKVFSSDSWEIIGIGDKFEPIEIGENFFIESIDQKDSNWAAEMQAADILLSLIASPHTSYPPLEMLVCGGVVVTNTFWTKTSNELRAYSDNMIPCEPSIDAIAEALQDARKKIDDESRDTSGKVSNIPQTWGEAFAPVFPVIKDFYDRI